MQQSYKGSNENKFQNQNLKKINTKAAQYEIQNGPYTASLIFSQQCG